MTPALVHFISLCGITAFAPADGGDPAEKPPAMVQPAVRSGHGAQPKAHGFAQAGIGLLEIGHVEAGAFLGPHVTVEAMIASLGVFGMHYGLGATYSVGTAQGGRPPRHAFLVGGRLMVDPAFTVVSHGDHLGSYAVIPVGYGFLADSGFYLRLTGGMAVWRERRSGGTGSELTIGGPMLTAAIGLVF